MKSTIIFIFCLAIHFTANTQTIIERQIKWEKPKSTSYYYDFQDRNIDQQKFLYFKDATFSDDLNSIPYYFELIKINAFNATAKIEIINTEPLTSEELSIIENKKLFQTDVKLTSSVQYKRQEPYLSISFLPIVLNTAGIPVKITSFRLIINPEKPDNKEHQYKSSFLSESVLKSGNWFKIKLNTDGIYKLPYSELVEMGFSDPQNIKIYGNSSEELPISNSSPVMDDLAQIDIYFENGTDGVFNSGDYILFYGKSPHQWTYDESTNFYKYNLHKYSDFNYYFLTTDGGTVSEVENLSSPAEVATEFVNQFTDYAHHEIEKENLLKSGQLWLGENFDIITTHNFEFNLPNLIKSTPVKFKISAAARSGASSTFNIKYNTTNILTLTIPSVNLSSYTSNYANIVSSNTTFLSSTDLIPIHINYNKSGASSEGWLDYITINGAHELRMTDNQLLFRYLNTDIAPKTIEFTLQNTNSATRIWNITNPRNPLNNGVSALQPDNSLKCKVTVQPGLNEFIAFNNTDYLAVSSVGVINNQNLHAINHRDMIIVSHPDFLSQANQIAAFHQSTNNLFVLVVTPEEIYNEFSSGAPDVSAIRNFARMVYNRPSASDTLKYLLLIGDGSYDHKSISTTRTNYIPTYQSINSIDPTSSFVTDDFFGLLDPTDNIELSSAGLVDIGIGRLPVQSATEAQAIVNKITAYSNPANYGNWINNLCFVGDDEDNNLHMIDADKLATFVDTTYRHFFIKKIYLDAFPQVSSAIDESYPEVNRLINEVINNGTLLFNYTGHGGERYLAHERILTIDNINSWKNSNRLAVFMTATCEFSRFDDHAITSAGEFVLLNPAGGGIALLSTTRLVYSNANYILNDKFLNYVFEQDYQGQPYALGDIIRLAKNASGTGNNKRNFTLLGDPALKLPIPTYTVITDSINGKNVSEYSDTLKALTKITITGHVEDKNSELQTGFNGTVYPTILDKSRIITTLGNGGQIPMDFSLQDNIIYKGKASITNGYFSFSFIVPKDISYSFGNGKISYFAESNSSQAKGSFTDFIIGGSSDSFIADDTGPSVRLYMNDENFVSGGVTNENPRLYVLIEDSSGINTTGNGIGHDITAILDNNTSNTILLNNYYESNIDDYQKGKIEYLFSQLDEGNHNLKLKVWDVYNNSTEEYLDFTVAETAELAIKNIFNYPNPFTENTSFFFDHNRPNEDLEVLIQIFTISGKLVKTIQQIINSNAFRSDAIPWDGLDDFGDKIGRGVYIYKIA
ncbi:MAG: type IX secretion system sortase PorU, partial [Bacteroidales bacterium]|nr:type IX secretion system sortase PorU [Bacteroidales bacterium]